MTTKGMCQQTPPFYVKTVRCVDGERLPTLVNSSTGLPDFEATLWVLTSLRSRNYASATIEQALRCIVVLYQVLQARQINLTTRLRAGCLLELADIEAISLAAGQKTATYFDFLATENAHTRIVSRRKNLESLRSTMNPIQSKGRVLPATVALRLGYIRDFLIWRVNRQIFRAAGVGQRNLLLLRDLVVEELKNKIPESTGRATLGVRMGIDRESQGHLLQTVNPKHPQNPWTGNFIRARNQLVIIIFLTLGIRRSELLGLRIADFNPRNQEVLILRRPDDQNDPRLNEPNTKTRDRVLPISADLYRLITDYLIFRHAIAKGSHDFLIVANTGAPLSSSGINRLFREFVHFSAFPALTPHILRHTFCENLAEDLFKSGCCDSEMLRYLRQLGGWSDNSKTPLRYIKRFAQERATAAGLALQRSLLNIPFGQP